MKIRNGLVSNSSSSSFIIGIFEIIDRELFDDYFSKMKKSSYEFRIVHVYDTDVEKLRKLYGSSIDDGVFNTSGELFVNSFNDNIITHKPESNKDYLIVDVTNNEGDSDFYNEQSEELDYDIDESFFIGIQHDAVTNNIPGTVCKGIQFGAARNG